MILKTSVPAKINLWLEVIRKREDGYHDISSLMLPISVFDRISLEVSRGTGRISLRCDAVEIPDDASNLAWRAAELFLGALGEQAGIDITLEKKIPSGAGLGGGSSDAAGVLVALNSCFDHALPVSLDWRISPAGLERTCLSFCTGLRRWRPESATGWNLSLTYRNTRCS